MGQLVSLADSEITAILQVVLTGLDTVYFHSVRVAVSFDAVSDQLSPCFRSSQPRLSMLHQFLAYLPGLPLRVPRRLWKVWDSNRTYSWENRFTVCRIWPLCQPSFCPYVLIIWIFGFWKPANHRGWLGKQSSDNIIVFDGCVCRYRLKSINKILMILSSC